MVALCAILSPFEEKHKTYRLTRSKVCASILWENIKGGKSFQRQTPFGKALARFRRRSSASIYGTSVRPISIRRNRFSTRCG